MIILIVVGVFIFVVIPAAGLGAFIGGWFWAGRRWRNLD